MEGILFFNNVSLFSTKCHFLAFVLIVHFFLIQRNYENKIFFCGFMCLSVLVHYIVCLVCVCERFFFSFYPSPTNRNEQLQDASCLESIPIPLFDFSFSWSNTTTTLWCHSTSQSHLPLDYITLFWIFKQERYSFPCRIPPLKNQTLLALPQICRFGHLQLSPFDLHSIQLPYFIYCCSKFLLYYSV